VKLFVEKRRRRNAIKKGKKEKGGGGSEVQDEQKYNLKRDWTYEKKAGSCKSHSTK